MTLRKKGGPILTASDIFGFKNVLLKKNTSKKEREQKELAASRRHCSCMSEGGAAAAINVHTVLQNNCQRLEGSPPLARQH